MTEPKGRFDADLARMLALRVRTTVQENWRELRAIEEQIDDMTDDFDGARADHPEIGVVAIRQERHVIIDPRRAPSTSQPLASLARRYMLGLLLDQCAVPPPRSVPCRVQAARPARCTWLAAGADRGGSLSADGVRIAYSVEGNGPPLLWSPLIFESLAKEAMTPVIAEFLRRLRERFSVIRFDQRGTGLSQRDVEDFSPAVTELDLNAVLGAAGESRVHLIANPGWTIHFLRYAAAHPDRVGALVAWNGQWDGRAFAELRSVVIWDEQALSNLEADVV